MGGLELICQNHDSMRPRLSRSWVVFVGLALLAAAELDAGAVVTKTKKASVGALRATAEGVQLKTKYGWVTYSLDEVLWFTAESRVTTLYRAAYVAHKQGKPRIARLLLELSVKREPQTRRRAAARLRLLTGETKPRPPVPQASKPTKPGPQQTGPKIKTVRPEGILSERKKAHPYLFFAADKLDDIRRRFRRPPQSWYLKSLRRQADGRARSAGGGGTHLWAYLLTGDKKYRRTCLDWVESEWDRKDFSEEWIGFKVNHMAQAYDTLYAELDDKARGQIKAYLERALEAHLKKMNSWFYNNPSNTVSAQGGAAGMAALALLWESPKAEAAALATRKKLQRYAARCFAKDGGYIEGTLYWSFGVSFYLTYAHADHNATGNNELLTQPNLLKQHRFAETMLGGDGQFMTFNDTQPWLNAWGVCTDLGRRTENELLLWLADHMAALTAGERRADGVNVDLPHCYPPSMWIMMTQSDPGPVRQADRDFPGVPTLSVLEHMQWGVMRSRGDVYIPPLVVGVKGSEGQLSHHKQNDPGSFVLYAGGEVLLLDPGYFNGGADCHTLPLVDGTGPKHSGSRIITAREDTHRRLLVIDSTRAYGKAAKQVRRTILMQGDNAVVVLDDILAAGAGKITAQYQAAHKAEVRNDGHVQIDGKKAALGLWTFGPKLELQSRRRDFGKSWQFVVRAQRGELAWHSLTGDYTAAPDTPLVTIMVAAAKRGRPAPPRVRRVPGRITVTLPPRGSKKIEFIQRNDNWEFSGFD